MLTATAEFLYQHAFVMTLAYFLIPLVLRNVLKGTQPEFSIKMENFCVASVILCLIGILVAVFFPGIEYLNKDSVPDFGERYWEEPSWLITKYNYEIMKEEVFFWESVKNAYKALFTTAHPLSVPITIIALIKKF